ncbi:MAG: hypothetical protein MI802_25220 [Desulfobacterales bacterium]|nr:hypothetical protein [Desulfobacterales bacterium]
MTDTQNQMIETLALTRTLLADMVTELKRKGCDSDDALIVRAGEVDDRLAAEEKILRPRAEPVAAEPAAHLKLHQRPAEAVNQLNLSESDAPDFEALGLPPHTREDLVEAAFTFENQLMATLGDDNAMPWEAYTDLPADRLIGIVAASVDKICRLGAG